MKIGSFDPHKPAQPASNATGGTREAKANAGTAPESSAKVELSKAATALAAADSGEFDAAKVARIAQAIRDGQFEVNAEAIADKLIANTRELLAPRSQH
ncbi:MAG TPA: flagellar biosynthesis anti-sigma factor FlgM [Burkholderiaceae bacterium]|nr:flagellar biosynthesis anti-sigma factor FlgM [Burkholderiaceae bacterium]